MRLSKQVQRGIIPVLFLCLELIVLCMGGRAFYAHPAEVAITDGVPSADYAPLLPPEGWSTQRQWFTARGEFFNRIFFYTMANEGQSGGLTINLRDENGAIVAAEHFSEEDCSAGALFFNIQKIVKYEGRYCFEAVADPGGSGWAVPYLFVPGGELSAWEDALYDEEPMGGGSCYLFLSFFYARLSYAAVCFHTIAMHAGAVYLFFCCFGKKADRTWGMDVAMLCTACVCAAGQFFLCKNYYLGKTVFLCLPCAFLAAVAALRLVGQGKIKIKLRGSWRSWETAAFLTAALLSAVFLLVYVRGKGFASIGIYFYALSFVFLASLFLGLLYTPRLDELCARFPWAVYAVESVLIFLQMEIANSNPFTRLKFSLAVWNIVTIFAVFVVLEALIGNHRWAGIVGTALFAVWGIANYFTVDFRGVPIAPGDLMSAGTALNVLGGYRFTLEMNQMMILLLVFWEILLLFRLVPKNRKRKHLLLRGTAILCAAIFFWQRYFGYFSPVEMSGWEWDWQLGYYPQGYVAVSMEKVRQLFTKAPAGYSSAQVQELYEVQCRKTAAVQKAGDVQPNIILIMNESWFDWRQVTEFETDRPVMPFIDSLENCVRGFAVGPQDRSGTSLSEYELLTSNSLSMMPEITPFTQRNLEKNCSVVSYLEALGYTTAAMHPGQAKNYNRSVVYPQLGFDRFYFAEDELYQDAQDLRVYVSDDSAFGTIKTLFEEKDTDTPKFLYLLTIQNHGGYDRTEKNGDIRLGLEAYTVNIESGFDEVKNAAEEYLSLIRCTDAVFEDLIQYFENCGEPTVVCMVGDHGPLLGGKVASPYEEYEWSMRQRGTPFIIWANYPIESDDIGYIGMVQLVPLLMKTAGLPLSPYYQTILDLVEEYPVISAAFYRDADGNFGDYSYTGEIPQSELLRQYFYFEYNSLLSPDKRIEEIFLAG